MSTTAPHRRRIRLIDPAINAAGVEACMRLQRRAKDLEDLDDSVFRDEVEIAKHCERRHPGFLRDCARLCGMMREYLEDEQRLACTFQEPTPMRGERAKLTPARRSAPPDPQCQ